MKPNAHGHAVCIRTPDTLEMSEKLRVKTADKYSLFSFTSGGEKGFSDVRWE